MSKAVHYIVQRPYVVVKEGFFLIINDRYAIKGQVKLIILIPRNETKNKTKQKLRRENQIFAISISTARVRVIINNVQ